MTKIYDKIVGNCRSEQWRQLLAKVDVTTLTLDQWQAQKSRLVATDTHGRQYPVALARGRHLSDGDILEYDPEKRHAVVVQLSLGEVMVCDLMRLIDATSSEAIHRAVELGHALGNQHWPAVIKSLRVYVPLTVDRKVMDSVMSTHHLEGVTWEFLPAEEVIPYLAPHEIRRLFGGAEQTSVEHTHHAEYAHSER
ncbi:MAG: urease accessory protein UreE [Rikenellaceae bacterium]|nr:urease accessory protein UreE [Rikenellaceae bacterium]